MKILLFGATGNIGRRITAEALRRGHQVTGVVRDPGKSTSPDARVQLVKGDATDAASVAQLARGAEAIVGAISPRPNANGLPAPSLRDAARAMLDGAKKADVKRIIWVGGAGSLEIAPGQRLMDAPNFPAAWRGEATEGADALDVFRTDSGDLAWTYFSPAAMIEPGERTGKFRLGGEQLVADAQGKSAISMEDYAAALIDELEKPAHIRQRFTAAY